MALGNNELWATKIYFNENIYCGILSVDLKQNIKIEFHLKIRKKSSSEQWCLQNFIWISLFAFITSGGNQISLSVGPVESES